MANDNRKRAVSIRMSSADVGKVRRLAQRLGVRDSDVFRYAVKTTLARLAPLSDPHVRGRSLVPVFLESSSDLFTHFDLVAARLEDIINEDAHESRRVDHEDIQLIAMNGTRGVAPWGLNGGQPAPGSTERGTQSGPAAPQGEATGPVALRDYLYSKYVYRIRDEA
jgi:hypothetical protein